MTINVIASATAGATSGVSSIALTVPAGVTNQHLGIIVISTNTSGTTDMNVVNWTQRIENPTGQSNSEFALFTRLGGHTAGNTINITIATPTGRVTRATGIWYNTGGNDVAIVGTAGTRNGTSSSTTTAPSLTTTGANQDVIVIATERTTAAATSLTGWSPATPVQDYYTENADTSVTHYFGHFTQATAGATGAYTATYSSGSGNAVAVMLALTAPAAPVSAPKISTFTANFSAPLDPVIWETTFDSNSRVVDGRLALFADTNFESATEWIAYDLSGSSVFGQMINADGASTSSFKILESVERYAGDNTAEWQIFAGALSAYVRNSGVVTTAELGKYDPAVHGRLFRIRNVTGSTLLFDTSIDGVTWVNRASHNVTWNITNVNLQLVTGGFSGQYSTFDNINIVPPAPTVSTVWSSEVNTTALSLGWTSTNVTYARAVLSTASDLSTPTYSANLYPTTWGNVAYRFSGLAENTLYYVGLEVNGVLSSSGRGQYRTARSVLGSSKVIASSCNLTGSTHAVFTQIKTQAPDFFTHMGDLHYADTNDELVWRTAFKSTLESSTFRPMLQTVTMTYDWNAHDAGGSGSSSTDAWATFAPAAVRELTGVEEYVDSRALYRCWSHAGVRYIELDRWEYRDQQSVVDSPSKTMLGPVQRDWLINLLQTASESAIVVFDGFPHYSNMFANGRWGSYPDEAGVIGAAIAALPAAQKNKIVFISGDSHGVHADSGANAMWGVPNLCASPLNQTGGLASGTWNIGNIDVNDTRGYFSRLTWTYTASSGDLTLVWDAVQDDGTVMLTWSKSFAADRDGWIKDPTGSGGKRSFRRRRNPALDPDRIDGENAATPLFSSTFDGLGVARVNFYETIFDGGDVNG